MTPVNWNCFGSNAHTAETYHCSPLFPVNSRHAAHLQPSPSASLREGKERISGLESQMTFLFLLERGGVGACASSWLEGSWMRRRGWRAGADQVLPKWDKSAFNGLVLCPTMCPRFSTLGVCETASSTRNSIWVQTLVSTGTENQRRWQNPPLSWCWRSCTRSCVHLREICFL